MLSAILFSIMTLTGLQQADSVSNDWLTKEWNKSYTTELFDFNSEGQIFIVSMKGEVIHQFGKMELANRCRNCRADYQKADFLFSFNNDDYFMLPSTKPEVQPSETVQYSSAE